MPFPSNDTNGSTAADRLVTVGKALRADAVKYIAQCDGGSVNAHDLVAAFAVNHLKPAGVQWAALSAVSGVQAIIRQRYSGFADDAAVTTALTAAQSAIDGTLAYVVTNTPVDGSGYTLTLKVVSNVFVQRVTTNAPAIAALKTQLIVLRDAFSV